MLMLLRVLLPLVLVIVGLLLAVVRDVRAQVPAAEPRASSPAGPNGPIGQLVPSAQAIERARRGLPDRQQVDRAMEALGHSAGVRVPAMAVDGKAQTGPDLSTLATQYERMRQGPAPSSAMQAERQVSGLMVFVSLGMPVASLERAVADAIPK